MIPDTNEIRKLRYDVAKAMELDMSTIPAGVNISTMTLHAKLNTKFYFSNIHKYMIKTPTGIVNVNKENNKKRTRQKQQDKIQDKQQDKQQDNLENKLKDNLENKLNEQVKSKVNTKSTKNVNSAYSKKNKKSTNSFLNQVTTSVYVSSKEKKPVSVKIFNNGSLHFTGCKCVNDFVEATYRLFRECRKTVGVMKDGKIDDVTFAENINDLRPRNIYGLKVNMINFKFNVPFNIDRPKLAVLLKSDGYNVKFDSNDHAGVKIKFIENNKKITIFVFEQGKIIIILGNQGFKRMQGAHDFIYKYLLDNYETIVRQDDIINSSILKYMADADVPKIKINNDNVDDENNNINNNNNNNNNDDIKNDDNKDDINHMKTMDNIQTQFQKR